MEQFLITHERQAYKMAHYATRNSADAMDIIQEAMIKLVKHYHAHSEDEWPPLFFKIVQRQITDFYRKQQRQKGVFSWFSSSEELAEDHHDTMTPMPDEVLEGEQALSETEHAVASLPARQQQVFLLRSLEGFSTKETADIMAISEGSVKTHYHRALTTLRNLLGEAFS